MSDHRLLAFYQQALGGVTAVEELLLRDEFLRRLIAAGITIDVNGLISGVPPPTSIGGLALSSLVAGDLLVATGASALARLAVGATGTILKGGSTPAWAALVNADVDGAAAIAVSKLALTAGAGLSLVGNALSASNVVLLKSNSGQTTSTSAENLDTIAISGLTAKDRLLVYYSHEAVTQNGGALILQNSTDSVTVSALSTCTAGLAIFGQVLIQQAHSAATRVLASSTGGDDATGARNDYRGANFTQNWTGSWTLALRQGGVTAGGTMHWSWSVYKMAGQ